MNKLRLFVAEILFCPPQVAKKIGAEREMVAFTCAKALVYADHYAKAKENIKKRVFEFFT